jgi:hypothetical protein
MDTRERAYESEEKINELDEWEKACELRNRGR